MPIKRPGRNGGTLTTPCKGDPSPNPRGRPKKYITALKEHGYKLCEIHDTMQVLLAMKKEDVHRVSEKEDSTVLERIVARALHGACKKGDLTVLETLLTRIYGRPAEYKPEGQKDDDYSKLTPEQFAERFRNALVRPAADSEIKPDCDAGSNASTKNTRNTESAS